ncbi:MAG TPA: fused MFS/spermidine synthase [Bryobacteraceae bacterium]|jgi:SAM-dependent methyltransferase
MKAPTTSTPSSLESALPESPRTGEVKPRVPALLFAATILLSAFLLFQVQPLIAKLILPWFGGSAAVWTSCMLFFQVALLGGYAYAHWVNGQTGRTQTIVHLLLLALSFLSLPILPSPAWKPHGVEDPLLRILGLLAATVGLPYFLLASTSPLLQSWYSRSNGGAMPYRFFALSNAGSMLGLLTYPVLIEPYLTSGQQAWMWSISYVAFVLVCGVVAWRSRDSHNQSESSETAVVATNPPSWPERFVWMGLAACASALLLAVTNHLTQNIAAIPFLWVLPLSLYLLSFILCFDSDRWYWRWLFIRLGAVALPAVAYAISTESDIGNLQLALGFFCTALFVLFMVCHGELARRRPAPAYLTSFYLMVSVGGAAGGLLIGFAAPYFLNGLYDLPIVVSLTGFMLVYLLWLERGRPASKAIDESSFAREVTAGSGTGTRSDKIIIAVLTLALIGYIVVRLAAAKFGYPVFLKTPFLNAPYDSPVLLGIAGLIIAYIFWRGRGALDNKSLDKSLNEGFVTFVIAAGLAIGICGFLARDTWNSVKDSRVLARNFYGALRVYDEESSGSMGPVRTLRHGTIDHGEEFLLPQNQRFATTYYATKSGVGLAIQKLQNTGPINVGVIGLGAGTIATYGRPVDHYTFYDINPLVLHIARTQFHFLRDCMAPNEVVLGDARLSLEGEKSKQFDVLAVDAFSGDAIPVHLLTRQAYQLYWRHLKPDGVLAVHVSNKYLNLGPVVALAAAEDGKQAMMVSLDSDDEKEIAASDWVLVSSRPGFFEQPEIIGADEKIEPIPGLRMWTDDYSNLYKILR